VGEQVQRRIRSDVVDVPGCARRLPEQRDLAVGTDVDVARELLGELEVILTTNADDLDCFLVVSSELLDVGAVAPTGRSMRCPIPGEHRSVAGHDLGQRGDLAAAHVEHLCLRNVVARDER